jgi:hypothetical protein
VMVITKWSIDEQPLVEQVATSPASPAANRTSPALRARRGAATKSGRDSALGTLASRLLDIGSIAILAAAVTAWSASTVINTTEMKYLV